MLKLGRGQGVCLLTDITGIARRAPNISIHKKSALRPRNDPSSNDLLYFMRKNMWNTKSRPVQKSAHHCLT